MSMDMVAIMVISMMLRLICAISILLHARITITLMMKTERGTAGGLITIIINQTSHNIMVTDRLGHSIERLQRKERPESTLSSVRVGVLHYPTTFLNGIKEPTMM